MTLCSSWFLALPQALLLVIIHACYASHTLLTSFMPFQSRSHNSSSCGQAALKQPAGYHAHKKLLYGVLIQYPVTIEKARGGREEDRFCRKIPINLLWHLQMLSVEQWATCENIALVDVDSYIQLCLELGTNSSSSLRPFVEI